MKHPLFAKQSAAPSLVRQEAISESRKKNTVPVKYIQWNEFIWWRIHESQQCYVRPGKIENPHDMNCDRSCWNVNFISARWKRRTIQLAFDCTFVNWCVLIGSIEQRWRCDDEQSYFCPPKSAGNVFFSLCFGSKLVWSTKRFVTRAEIIK